MAVTTPDPHAAGSTRFSQWWVLRPSVVSRGQPAFTVVMATSKPKPTGVSSVAAGPFTSRAAAENWISKQTAGPALPNVGGWLNSLGGDIASGMETAFVVGLKDLWNVIAGPIEVGLGLIIVVVTLYLWMGGSAGTAVNWMRF